MTYSRAVLLALAVVSPGFAALSMSSGCGSSSYIPLPIYEASVPDLNVPPVQDSGIATSSDADASPDADASADADASPDAPPTDAAPDANPSDGAADSALPEAGEGGADGGPVDAHGDEGHLEGGEAG